MKSSYAIKREMEEKFGKEFINKIEKQKEEYERLTKELEKAKSFEEKVNEKVNQLRKNFIYISDNYNIYPQETCSNYLYQFANKIVEEDIKDKNKIEELQYEYEMKIVDSLQEDIKLIQNEINNVKESWKDDEE